MRSGLRSHVTLLAVAAVLLPWPAAADDVHPRDPAAPAGAVPTDDLFQALVPLVTRDSPQPSFVPGQPVEPPDPATTTEASPAVSADPGAIDHAAMGHVMPGDGAAP